MSIALSSISAFITAVASARTVDLCAYTLRAGSVRDALLDAARRGAHVRVRLEADPIDDAAASLHAANAETIAVLRAAGADAALREPLGPVLHMKAATVDGQAWLDDRNWAGEGRETVVRDSDDDDVAAIVEAIRGGSGGDGHLRTTKSGAALLEIGVIRDAGRWPLALESESFGSGGVYNALLSRARAGNPTRLLVAGREATAAGPGGETERKRLSRLAALGVDVRTGIAGKADLDEKIAVGAHTAWIGSANATYARGPAGEQRDWGMSTRQPGIVDGLRAAFERNWSEARAFVPTSPAAAGCADAGFGPRGGECAVR